MSGTAHAIAATALLVVTAVRVYELLRALLWIATKGNDYASRRREMSLASLADFDQVTVLYETTGALFRSFGVRLGRLRRTLARTSPGWRRHALTGWWRLIRSTWPYYAFVGLVGGTTVFSASVVDVRELGLWGRSAHFAIVLLLLIGSVSIATELVLCHLIMGSWTAYYNPALALQNNRTAEITFFVGAVIVAYSTGVLATFCSTILFDPFERIDRSNPWTALGDSCYYVWTALTGNGDAGPTRWPGKIVTAGVYVHHAAFVFMALTIIGGVVLGQRERIATDRPQDATIVESPNEPARKRPAEDRTWIAAVIAAVALGATLAVKRALAASRSRSRRR
ncbi:hypothetical protein ACFWN2_08745 [Lentzea sp. NPDC058436]|uniref:hypothetical protein n=1 Tax=Lentzea sp. NPDC058436 TaxID=3346499 RepID=UPI00365177F8